MGATKAVKRSTNRFLRHALCVRSGEMLGELREAKERGETETVPGCSMSKRDYRELLEASRRARVPLYAVGTACILSANVHLRTAGVTVGRGPLSPAPQGGASFRLRLPAHIAGTIVSAANELQMTPGELAGWMIAHADSIEAEVGKLLDRAGY